MTIRLGLIGSGYMASEYLRAANAVSDIEFVSIYSRNTGTATQLAQEYRIDEIVKDIAELGLQNLDFLIICVPELATEQIILECSSLKIPLLVEKPIGIDYVQAKRIEKAAEESSTQIYAALNRRFYSSTLAVMNEISSTSTPRFVSIVDQENTISATKAGQPVQVVDHWMYANSIHIIDFISFICRGEAEIISKRKTILSEDSFVQQTEISFTSGDAASYTCYWNTAGGWSVNVNIGTQAWQLSPLEVSRSRGLDERRYLDNPEDPLDTMYKPGLVRILQEVVKHCNNEEHKLCSISEVNRTMRLIEMIYFND